MPGNFTHVSSVPEDVRSSEIGVIGVIAPDLWKKHTPTKSEYAYLFRNCLDKAPSYEQVLKLCSIKHGGTHFGSEPGDTNHADFKLLKSMFEDGEFDSNSLFFKGYIHHLRVDYEFYSNPTLCNNVAFEKDFALEKNKAMTELHADWDKTNFAISSWYPEVIDLIDYLPEEAKKVIKFVEGECKYISTFSMKDFIEDMRKPRSLEELLGSE